MYYQLGDALKGHRKDTSLVPCSSAPGPSQHQATVSSICLGISLVFECILNITCLKSVLSGRKMQMKGPVFTWDAVIPGKVLLVGSVNQQRYRAREI